MMKRITVLITITVMILGLAACSGQSAVTVTETATPTAAQAEPTPAKIAAPYPKALPTAAATLPGLLGEKWYDFDKVGAYPRAYMTQCGDRIAFSKPVNDGEGYIYWYLAFADPDGSNCVCTEVKYPRCLNYKDGWVYFIDDGYRSIYKIKTDGSGLKTVCEGFFCERLLLIEDKLYFFERHMTDTERKYTLMRYNLDGSGREALCEFSYSSVLAYDNAGNSLFYDSGKLYLFIDNENGDTRSDLYRYDLADGSNTCLAKDLPVDQDVINSNTAVRGDYVFYYERDKGVHVYSISTGEDVLFAPIQAEYLALFDRWLLISSYHGLYCYDLMGGDMYLLPRELVVPGVVIMPTQNNLYLVEPGDRSVINRVVFKDGKVTLSPLYELPEEIPSPSPTAAPGPTATPAPTKNRTVIIATFYSDICGGYSKGKWLSYGEAAKLCKGKMAFNRYDLEGFNGTVESSGVTYDQEDDSCPGYFYLNITEDDHDNYSEDFIYSGGKLPDIEIVEDTSEVSCAVQNLLDEKIGEGKAEVEIWTAAIADIDGDGEKETVAEVGDTGADSEYNGLLCVIESDGTAKVIYEEPTADFSLQSIIDIDGDGISELVVYRIWGEDYGASVYKYDGKKVKEVLNYYKEGFCP